MPDDVDHPLVIRTATPDDRAFLLALTAELGAFPVPAWRTPEEIGAADRAILEAAILSPGPDTLVLIAELDGTPAGSVFVSTRSDYFNGERLPHVEVLAVTPAARGRGVAAALMHAAERWARDRGDRVITLNVFETNARARALYARLGYEPETLHYRKPLAAPAPEPAESAWQVPPDLRIRLDRAADADGIWAIMEPVLRAGETYAWAPDTTRDEALRLWHPPGARTFVAEADGAVLGTYFLKANQPALGNHVANCGYMVAPAARGRRVGEAMCRHSLDVARGLGFSAMQFNAVVSTNTGAVALWRRCGFSIVGTVPGAFRHPTKGRVAIHVMYRSL